MLRLAATPADKDYPHGRSKAEYFAAGVEGALIVLAAAGIVWAALPRLFDPRPLAMPLAGIALTGVATAINLAVGAVLLRAGHTHHSITLEADGRHLLTDVWTSFGVIAGVALVAYTGWLQLDPLVALLVAAHILWIGFGLVRRSISGLLDPAIAHGEQSEIAQLLAEYSRRYGVSFHAVRTRQAGARRFISFHLLVPDEWNAARARDGAGLRAAGTSCRRDRTLRASARAQTEDVMSKNMSENMSNYRRRFVAFTLASVLLAGGFGLAAREGALAQTGPSQEEILKALKPAAKTRALTTEQSQQASEEQKFIDSLRRKTRSLTTSERQQVAAIVKEKPSIDLEVYFDFNSAEITPKAAPDLMNLGKALSDPQLAGGVFMLGGHTDAKGGEEYNQRLSERRAQAVKTFLLDKFRLPEDSLVTAGYGKEQLKNAGQPFAPENRRVQIVNLEAKQKAEK